MPPISETETIPAGTNVSSQDSTVTREEEFIPIGAGSKPKWKIFLRGDTTDVKIHKQGPGILTHTVIQAEKILKN